MIKHQYFRLHIFSRTGARAYQTFIQGLHRFNIRAH